MKAWVRNATQVPQGLKPWVMEGTYRSAGSAAPPKTKL